MTVFIPAPALPTSSSTDGAELSALSDSLRIGIDVGGTSIKYAVVDTATGVVMGQIAQMPTPQPATPDSLAQALRLAVEELRRQWPSTHPSVGVAFPSVIRDGVACSAANISPEWIGVNANDFLSDQLGCEVKLVNDADAAAVAEVAHRAGLGTGLGGSVVLVLTLGTGIGSALVVDGRLVPNFELGHLFLGGRKAEAGASAVARERDGLSWAQYAVRLQEYLSHVEFLFSPDVIILGGGISVRHGEYLPLIDVRATIFPAMLANAAGVVGAAQVVAAAQVVGAAQR